MSAKAQFQATQTYDGHFPLMLEDEGDTLVDHVVFGAIELEGCTAAFRLIQASEQ